MLIQPKFSNNSFWNYTEVCKLTGAKYPAAPLGLLTVAALLPKNWKLKLVDENVSDLKEEELDWADIILTGGMLPQQTSILRIIDIANKMRKTVVVGGPDPSSQPDIYGKADFLVLGEAEVTIEAFLNDLSRNRESGVYFPDRKSDMEKSVIPRYDLIDFRNYLHIGIQYSRGCPYNCEFCDIIEMLGRKPRVKTCEQIISELNSLYNLGYRGHIDFVDDNFIGNKCKVMEVLDEIAKWSKEHDYPFYFSTEASINLAKEEKLLELMEKSDFRYVFIGIESPDNAVLEKAQKKQNVEISVKDAVRILSSYGLIVNGGFILGFDNESSNIADNMIDLIQDSGICMAMVGTLYALPNTQLTRRLRKEGRLFNDSLKIADSSVDIDQITSGLNFITSRSRINIINDHIDILKKIYDPVMYYKRIYKTALNIKPTYKNKPGFLKLMKLALGFLRVCTSVGLNRKTRLLYWNTLLKVILKNPKAVEVSVNLAAMYLHFSKQNNFVIKSLHEKIETIKMHGEEKYNQLMLTGLKT